MTQQGQWPLKSEAIIIKYQIPFGYGEFWCIHLLFWNSNSFILWTRKFKVEKFKYIIYVILNFPAQELVIISKINMFMIWWMKKVCNMLYKRKATESVKHIRFSLFLCSLLMWRRSDVASWSKYVPNKCKKMIEATSQGMYKNRVKNDRKFFEIPSHLSCEWGKPEQENSKWHIYIFLNFSASFYAEFPRLQYDKIFQ